MFGDHLATGDADLGETEVAGEVGEVPVPALQLHPALHHQEDG